MFIAQCCFVLLGLILGSLAIITLIGVIATQASPALFLEQKITTLTSAQFDAFTPFTNFACAAYFKPSETLAWSCGSSCDYNSGFKPIASGGDGSLVQFWYVGYDPKFNTIIVGHQGTVVSRILPALTDSNLILNNLDASLFPGLPSEIQVHDGFKDVQNKTAVDILVAVQTGMSKYGTTSVTLVGHSLGGALSLLDSVYLQLHLSPGTTIKAILYGLPRVGNQAFADYVDANLNITHINNMEDPVPTVPGRFLGYVQVSGELHITQPGQVAVCLGQDNPSTRCISGQVTNVFEAQPGDHTGPYGPVLFAQC